MMAHPNFPKVRNENILNNLTILISLTIHLQIQLEDFKL